MSWLRRATRRGTSAAGPRNRPGSRTTPPPDPGPPGHPDPPQADDVPAWAATAPGVSWADTPREDKLAEWTASMQPSISGWLAQLPEDFVEDYSRASLAELEQVLLDRYPDAATMVVTGSLFAETAARYAGQSWLQVCGGRWDWTRDDPRSVWPDQPLVRPDTRSQVPVPVFARIRDVVADRTGTALTRTWDALDRQRRERADAEPGWTPQPPDTDSDPATS